MHILREAFRGGERYYCYDCGKVVEINHYPETETGTSAEEKFLRLGKEEAAKLGITFSGYIECDCIQTTAD